jgi:hypothetical protein
MTDMDLKANPLALLLKASTGCKYSSGSPCPLQNNVSSVAQVPLIPLLPPQHLWVMPPHGEQSPESTEEQHAVK